MSFTELAAVTGGTLLGNEANDLVFRGISIDSRKVKQGELFIAIRGEKQDGHRFIDQALEKGAAGIIVETSYAQAGQIGGAAVITVADSHQAMIDLARNYRDSLTGKFIGITGSNGKTTTKELCYRMIRTVDENAFCSPGNLNNLYGVPLSLFAVPKEARVVVLELGISTKNEMPRLAEIVRPDVVVITNVGPSHLEFLNTIEDVARSKLELVRQAEPDVPVIINADDELLVRETKKIRRDYRTFALASPADFTADKIELAEDGTSRINIDGHLFRLPLVGRHQVYNLIAAYAVFRTLGYDFGDIDTESISLNTAPMRGQLMLMNSITFIADCYNSNPESARAGLEAYFATATAGKRIVVLGDMLELGETSEHYHRQIGRLIASYEFDKAILVGEQSKFVIDEAIKAGAVADRFEHHDTAAEAAESMRTLLKAGDLVYVKGSRGIGLEAVLNVFSGTEDKN